MKKTRIFYVVLGSVIACFASLSVAVATSDEGAVSLRTMIGESSDWRLSRSCPETVPMTKRFCWPHSVPSRLWGEVSSVSTS